MLGMMLALVLAQGAPAAAETTKAEVGQAEVGQAEAKATVAAKPEKPKKICVEEQQMGSHFKRKICATAEEWEKRREQDAKVMSRGANAPVCGARGC